MSFYVRVWMMHPLLEYWVAEEDGAATVDCTYVANLRLIPKHLEWILKCARLCSGEGQGSD